MSINARDAYIFCAFAQERLKHLQQIARELDDEYAKTTAEAS